MIRTVLLIVLSIISLISLGQDTILVGHNIAEIIFIEDRDENERVFNPSQKENITLENILLSPPGTAAQLLQNNGEVMTQMSQSGGGSPIIRGFEANRILLVVDGIRMNNAIYRSGHLQNSISISPLMLQKVDVIFGPSSVKYGSDALGGVIHYHTKSPSLRQKWKGQVVQRYNSVNEGVSLYYEQQWGNQKWAFFQAINLNHYGNVKMGKNRFHGYENWGIEEYLTDKNEQLKTAYDQLDFIQKIKFEANKHLSYKLNLQLSSTTNLNRFDQLNDKNSSGLAKYEEWYYGPQKRLLTSMGLEHQKKTSLYDSFNNTTSLQLIEESRNTKTLNSHLIQRVENVTVLANTSDFIKKWGYSTLNYGVDLQFNTVASTATQNYYSRYADGGSNFSSWSIYTQFKQPFGNSYASGGLRFNNTQLSAKFNRPSTLGLPYNKLDLSNQALTSSIGIFVDMGSEWNSSVSLSTGFRSPNVDDVTKVFAKSGRLTVPNNELKPEYSKNIEINLKKQWNKSYLTATYYYTQLKDAIIKKPYSLNGQDSLWYDGEYLPIQTNANSQEAYLFGYNIKAHYQITPNWSSSQSCNYTFGKDQTEQVPLDHIPPFYGKSQLSWQKNKHHLIFMALFNSWKRLSDYSPNGSDNPEEATEDGTPSWWTLNIAYSVSLSKKIIAQIHLENLLDAHYKTYSSGISAPGRNIALTLRAEL